MKKSGEVLASGWVWMPGVGALPEGNNVLYKIRPNGFDYVKVHIIRAEEGRKRK